MGKKKIQIKYLNVIYFCYFLWNDHRLALPSSQNVSVFSAGSVRLCNNNRKCSARKMVFVFSVRRSVQADGCGPATLPPSYLLEVVSNFHFSVYLYLFLNFQYQTHIPKIARLRKLLISLRSICYQFSLVYVIPKWYK